MVLAGFFVYLNLATAAANNQINYQGKLLDSVGNPVADGSYNMHFRLCADSACSVPVFDEAHIGANKIAVSNGLFSAMIGAVSSTLDQVNFNQVLYLEVNIGGTSTPAFETLLPRKILGSVPNAFNAQKLDGLATSSLAVLTRANTYTATNTFANLVVNGSSNFLSTTTFGTGTDTLRVAPFSLGGGLVTGLELSGSTNVGINVVSIRNGLALRGVDFNPSLQFGDQNFSGSAVITYDTSTTGLSFSNALSYHFDNDLTVLSGKGITLGGVYRMTWPVSGGSAAGSFWATSTNNLIGYPDLAGNFSIIIGAAATTSDDFDPLMRLKVVGNTKLTGGLTVQGNVSSSGYVNAGSSTQGFYLHGTKFISSPADGFDASIAIGFNSLLNNTTGFLNTAIGSYALGDNQDGTNNLAVGYNSLRVNISGSLNTAVGNYAMISNLNGGYNAVVGRYALGSSTSGTYNTAIGDSSLRSSITGNYNTMIGGQADVLYSNLNNATAIGYNAKVGGSNMLVLGGTSSNAVLVGIGTSTPNAYLNIYGDSASNYLLRVATSTNQKILVVSNLGNVGIGTSTPSRKLTVSGDAYISGTTTAACFTVDGVNCITGGLGSSPWLTSGSDIYFATGNVGIGTTTPKAQLTVSGLNSEPLIYVDDKADPLISWKLYSDSIDGGAGVISAKGTIDLSGNSASALSFKDGLILTPSSDYSLFDVLSLPSSVGFVLGNNALTTTTAVAFNYNTGNFNFINDYGSFNFIGSNNKGNVGIGTENPNEKLTVNGNAYITGTTTAACFTVDGINCLASGGVNLAGIVKGSVLFAGAGETITQNNANFYWDDTNKRLAVGPIPQEFIFTQVSPTMTSNTVPAPYDTSASSVYGGQGAWMAFDGRTDTLGWISATNDGWVKLNFGSQTYVNGYQVTGPGSYLGVSSAPKTWTFEGSNDDSSWTVLDTQTNAPAWTLLEVRNYNLVSTVHYRYYRINVSASEGGELVIQELALGNSTIPPPNPLAKLHLAPTFNTEKGLIIQGASTQTANLQEWQNYTGSILSTIDSSGHLQIGTSTAIALLAIQGTSSASTLPLLSITSSTGASLLHVSNNGNIGIGTNSPTYDLHVKYNRDSNAGGMIVENSNSGTSATAEVRLFNDAGQAGSLFSVSSNYNFYNGIPTGSFGLQAQAGHSLFLGTTNDDTILFVNKVAIAPVIAMAIKDGKVGIGTTTPDANLTVFGSSSATTLLHIATLTNQNILVVNNQGNVGIGTNNPTVALDVNGSIRVSPGNAYWLDGRIIAQASTTLFNYYFGNSGNSSSTGNSNTGVGQRSLFNNENGYLNTAIGAGALQNNISGSENTAVGGLALYSNGTGVNNTAMGYGAMYWTASSTGNVVIGFQAGYGTSTSVNNFNTIIGYQSGLNLSNGSYNSLLGFNAGFHLTSGAGNVLLGDLAGYYLDTGSNNILIGSSTQALGSNSNNYLNIGNALYGDLLSGNIGIGSTTPSQKLSVTGNAYISGTTTAACFTVDGINCIAGGPGGSPWLNNGSSIYYNVGNVGIGSSTPSDKLSIDGSINITAGNYYKYDGLNFAFASTSKANYFFGNAGNSTMSGSQNVGFGANALWQVTSGSANSAFGHSAMSKNISGNNNTAVGDNAMFANTSGSYNTIQGFYALAYNETGSYNTANGYLAGVGSDAYYLGGYYSIADASSTYIGAYASRDSNIATSTPVVNATALGYNAKVGGSNMLVLGGTSTNAVFVGVGTSTPNSYLNIFGASATNNLLRVATSTNQNIFVINNAGNLGIGTSTPAQRLSVVGNVNVTGTTTASCFSIDGINCLGGASSQWITSGSNIYYALGSIAVGTSTVTDKLTVAGNIQILDGGVYKLNGINLAYGTSTAGNYFFGGAGNLTMTGTYNTGVGFQALASTTNASENTGVGYQALLKAQSGLQNTALGFKSLFNNDGSYNTAIGDQSMYTNAGGTYNTALGQFSLFSNSSGHRNVSVGYQSLYTNVASDNTAFGYQTLYSNSTGIENVGLGKQALYTNVGASGNVAVGSNSMYHRSSGDFNTAVGHYSLHNNATGANNTVIGVNALLNSSAGSNNVAVGFSAGEYELGSDSFYVDNQDRGSTAGDKAGALLYGTFNATPASQNLRINASTTIAYTLRVSQTSTLATTTLFGTLLLGTTTASSSAVIFANSGASLTAGGVWTNSSDRNLKENFTDVDANDILNKIVNLPVQLWNYKVESSGIKHLGPVAQDFYAAFGLGGTDTAISTIDPAGVALIGIKALQQQVTELSKKLVLNSASTGIDGLEVTEANPRFNTLRVTSAATFYGEMTVIGAAGFKSKVTFEKEVNFKDKIYVSQDSAGEIIIKAGTTTAQVVFSQPYISTPRIVANISASGTPTFINYNIINKSKESFSIVLERSLSTDVYFDWIAVGSIEVEGNLTPSNPVIDAIANPILTEPTATVSSTSSSTNFELPAVTATNPPAELEIPTTIAQSLEGVVTPEPAVATPNE